MNRHWILEGRTPKPVDLMTWARWFEDLEARRIGYTEIGEAAVSTVFLGIDHNFTGKGPPILFETMISGVSSDGAWDHQSRYATYTEAEEGHALAVEWVRSVVDLAGADGNALMERLTKKGPS